MRRGRGGPAPPGGLSAWDLLQPVHNHPHPMGRKRARTIADHVPAAVKGERVQQAASAGLRALPSATARHERPCPSSTLRAEINLHRQLYPRSFFGELGAFPGPRLAGAWSQPNSLVLGGLPGCPGRVYRDPHLWCRSRVDGSDLPPAGVWRDVRFCARHHLLAGLLAGA